MGLGIWWIKRAAGKPVPILSALYCRAKEDPGIELEIYTALTLAKPRGKSLLGRRFLELFAERVFGDYPDSEFHLDREQDALPSNVRVIEFYFPAGKQLDSRHSQENYVSAGYGGNKLVIYDSHTMKKVKTFSMKVPAGVFSHMRARAMVLGLENVLPWAVVMLTGNQIRDFKKKLDDRFYKL